MKILDGLLAAIVVFTRIPVTRPLAADAFTRASLHLPLLGLILGGMQAALLFILSRWMPLDLAVFFTLLFPCVLSGGMHEDGLADFSDAMLGGHTVAKRLAIMKDPRVGSAAVLALIAVLAAEFLALRNSSSAAQLRGLVLSAVLSRSLSVLLLGTLPYLEHAGSRSQGFLPESFHGWRIVLPLWPLLIALGLLPMSWTSLAFPGLFLGLFLGFRQYLHRRLGGLTGDCLGAVIKIAAACFLLLSCMLDSKAGGL